MPNEHTPSESAAESRRRFLKKAGATAFAGPMIVTLLSSSTSAQAAPPCGVAVFDVQSQTFGCTGGATCGSGGVCVPAALFIGAECNCQTGP